MGYVTVKVEGDDREQVNGVAAGVMVGLENTGFKNVRLAVEYEAKDIEAVINRARSLDAPSTMLATLKMRNPDLFEQPVVVQVPAVKPTGGLTVYQTADSRILEEPDSVADTEEKLHELLARAWERGQYLLPEELEELRTDEYRPFVRFLYAVNPIEDHVLVLSTGNKYLMRKPPDGWAEQKVSELEAQEAVRAVEHGLKHPYDGRKLDASPARAAALGILADLTDRSGIGDELEQLDDGLRQEITNRWTAIVEASSNATNAVELYNAVQGLVEGGIMSKERAATFLHSMNSLRQ